MYWYQISVQTVIFKTKQVYVRSAFTNKLQNANKAKSVIVRRIFIF
jgi:hypothetical protein